MRSPGQNGSRERGFGTLKYERLFLDEIRDARELVERAEDYRIEYNTVRPHEAIAWNRPLEVHLSHATPRSPTLIEKKSCQLLDAGHTLPRSFAATCFAVGRIRVSDRGTGAARGDRERLASE